MLNAEKNKFKKSHDDVVMSELKRTRAQVSLSDLIKRGRDKDIAEIFKIIQAEEKRNPGKEYERMLYNRKDRFGFSMLYHAAMNGHYKIVVLLVSQVDRSVEKEENNYRKTALFTSVKWRYWKIAEYLL